MKFLFFLSAFGLFSLFTYIFIDLYRMKMLRFQKPVALDKEPGYFRLYSAATGNSLEIRLRRDNSVEWVKHNPTLRLDEPGVETDTGKFKMGDGQSDWNSLEYCGSMNKYVRNKT